MNVEAKANGYKARIDLNNGKIDVFKEDFWLGEGKWSGIIIPDDDLHRELTEEDYAALDEALKKELEASPY